MISHSHKFIFTHIPRAQIPHVNSTKHKHYTEVYSKKAIDYVTEVYAKDIEYFGYKFK